MRGAHSRKSAPARVRIIGGQWRSRWLPVVSSPGLRPSADAQRETIFNWLAPFIEGARVLDLFAGTGAFGFEAASRGASRVTLVESHPRVHRQLLASKASLQAEGVEIRAEDVQRFLANPPATTGIMPGYDIIFLDPPFGKEQIPRVLAQLCSGPWLRGSDTLIYIEQERTASLPSTREWEFVRQRQCGEARGLLIRKNLLNDELPTGS